MYNTVRGLRTVPQIFLKSASSHAGSSQEGYHTGERYYAQSSANNDLNEYYPVKFNTEYYCWVEVCWIENLEIGGHWEAFCSAGPDLGLDITIRERNQHFEDESVTSEPSIQRPRTRSPFHTTTPSERAHSPTTQTEDSPCPEAIELFAPETSPAAQELTRLAESLHIDDRMATQTMTVAAQVGAIDPITGHMTTEDDVALHRAIGPDRADPPPGLPRPQLFFQGQNFPVRRPPRGGPPGGGPPRGGPPGANPPGGGPPGRGFAVPPILPQPQGHHGGDKLVGNPPLVFKGDRTKTKEFATQWSLYEGGNVNNSQMRSPFQRAMLFLTYIQGPDVNEWVKAMSAWLHLQITRLGVPMADEWLWDSTSSAFNRQYADILEQEKAKIMLRQGFKMEREELDAYISKFEQAVRHAGFDVNDPMVLDKFTDGLPRKMYEDIYTAKHPHTYEQWRQEAINQQRAFIHLRARLNNYRTTPTTAAPRPAFNSNWRGAPKDPNAMDLSPGRTRVRLANTGEAPHLERGGFRGNAQQRSNREVI